MYNNNKYNSHRLPLITPEMLRHQPDQACEILNKLSGGGGGEATVINEGTGNLEDIQQTTTSYDDGGVNIVTAYLSGGATSDFQIRNGRKGSQGDPGPAGQDGADGADGFSPIATVTKSGDTATITITDQGGTTTATVSDGAQGDPGAPGPANTLSIGTVQQGATADATITGTSPNQTLNLTLPKGDQGPAGPANSLSIGTVQQGITADATITGTPPNQVLNLSLPKGDPGQDANVVNAYTTSTTDAYSADYINNLSISATVVVTYNSGAGTWSSSKEIIDAIESGDSLVWQHSTSPATEVYTVLSAEILSSTTASLAVKICDTTNDTTHVESYVLSGADTTSGTYAIDIGEEPVFVDSVLSSGGSSLIQTTDIADGSITFPKLSFDGVQINSVLSSGGTSQIQTTDIADGAITSDKIDSTTLYTSSTGTQTDFSLSDSPANYDHVEVYFSKQNFATCKQCTIFSGDSTKWFLSIVNPGTGTDSTFYINSAVLDISGTNVAYTAGREGYFNSNAQSVGSDTKPLKIFKVIGYK